MSDKGVHEHKREAERRLDYHERCLPSISVCFKSDVQLSSLDDTVAATQESFGDERPEPFPDGIVLSVPTSADDGEGDYDLLDIPFGSSSTHEQCHLMLSNFQGLVICAACSDPDGQLNVLHLA